MPRPDPDLLGKQVLATSPQGRIWSGKLIGLADHPTLVLEQSDGTRLSLPQSLNVVEDTHPVVPVVDVRDKELAELREQVAFEKHRATTYLADYNFLDRQFKAQARELARLKAEGARDA